MALVIKKRSLILSVAAEVTTVSNTPIYVGSLLFGFNKMVQVRSVMAYFQGGGNTLFQFQFTDLDGNYIQYIPVKINDGFSGEGNQGGCVSAGNQVFYENMMAGGIELENLVSEFPVVSGYVYFYVEILESYLEEEFGGLGL